MVSRIPTPRGNVVATAVGNHLYAIAGILDRAGADRQDSGPCDVVERFDVEQGQWFGCAPLPAASVKPGVAVVDKTIYALGGRQGEDDSSMIFAYDTVADSWSQAGQLPYGARHGAACSWEGKIYYSGGFQAGPNHGTFHQSLTVFDPDSGEVKSLEPMPEARTAHAMLASQGDCLCWAVWMIRRPAHRRCFVMTCNKGDGARRHHCLLPGRSLPLTCWIRTLLGWPAVGARSERSPMSVRNDVL